MQLAAVFVVWPLLDEHARKNGDLKGRLQACENQVSSWMSSHTVQTDCMPCAVVSRSGSNNVIQNVIGKTKLTNSK